MADETDEEIEGPVGDLLGRLENWKFESAERYAAKITDLPKEIGDDVRTLSLTFSNSGWFDGLLSEVLRLAVANVVERITAWHRAKEV